MPKSRKAVSSYPAEEPPLWRRNGAIDNLVHQSLGATPAPVLLPRGHGLRKRDASHVPRVDAKSALALLAANLLDLRARVAELVDAHDSGSCVLTDVLVRFQSRAPQEGHRERSLWPSSRLGRGCWHCSQIDSTAGTSQPSPRRAQRRGTSRKDGRSASAALTMGPRVRPRSPRRPDARRRLAWGAACCCEVLGAAANANEPNRARHRRYTRPFDPSITATPIQGAPTCSAYREAVSLLSPWVPTRSCRKACNASTSASVKWTNRSREASDMVPRSRPPTPSPVWRRWANAAAE